MARTAAPSNAHPSHFIVDGSNIATEGRATPSLKQLNEAVIAFIEEHPGSLITVVVDATFGHRIDKKEVKAFDEAVANNELVTPPAGAVGRGDAFVLSIAHKAKAGILSNDSFQEFHGDYGWLFDPGRLIGGKPVPHVGWVFVERLPVRGPKSRQAVKDAKQTTRPTSSRAARGTGSTLAEQPMPVPTAPPPGLALTTKAKRQPAAAAAVLAAAPGGNGVPQAGRTTVNDLLPFLEFVERHPVGTGCTVVVESYASHGAYARAGDVLVYVPLRLMGDPPPRSARAALKIGEAVAVVIVGYVPERRSIDAALASAGEAVKAQVAAPETPAVAEMPATKRRSRSKQAAEAPADLEPAVAAEPVAETPSKRRRAAKKATVDVVVATPTEQPALPLEPVATPDEVEVKPARRTRRKAAAAPPAAPEPTVEPKPTRKRAAKQVETAAAASPATAAKPAKRAPRPAKAASPAPAEQPKPARKRAAKPKPEQPGA